MENEDRSQAWFNVQAFSAYTEQNQQRTAGVSISSSPPSPSPTYPQSMADSQLSLLGASQALAADGSAPLGRTGKVHAATR